MKQLRIWTIAALAAAPLATAAQTLPSNASSSMLTVEPAPSEVEVNIDLDVTSATSREDLAAMQRDAYPQGVKFQYSEIAFANGRLTDIRIMVSTTAGKEIEQEFRGIKSNDVIRLVVRGSGDAQQICLGTDCDRKFPRRD